MSWKLDDITFQSYGVYVIKHSGVLDLPAVNIHSFNWLDNDGIDYWPVPSDYKDKDREIKLDCLIMAGNLSDFSTKLSTFINAIKAEGMRQLLCDYVSTAVEVYLKNLVKVERLSSWHENRQFGTFTLRFTVPGDLDYYPLEIKRWTAETGTVVISTVLTNDLKIYKSLQGDIYAQCTFESNTKLPIKYFDFIRVNSNGVNDDTFHIPFEPTFEKKSTNKYVYNIRFEHQSSWLKNSQFLDELKQADFEYYANIDEIMDLIISNHDREWNSNFQKGTVVSTLRRNHKFTAESCLDVLRRLCEEYKLEYEFEYVTYSVYKINIKEQVANDKTTAFEYGKGSGLYELSREEPNMDELCTILFAFGSTRNVPAGYRLGMQRLAINNPIKNNEGLLDGAGPHEVTQFFDDIYPRRNSTLTGYTQVLPDQLTAAQKETYPDGIYKCTDSTIEFNLEDYYSNGLTPKIRFNTGDNAGLEFEICRWDNDTKEIFLIPFKNIRGVLFPNADLHPSGESSPGAGDGDSYVLVDIEMPEDDIIAAETELLAAAQDYIDEFSIPKFPYQCKVDPAFLLINPDGFEIGDRIPVIDTDYGINGMFRISGLEYDVYRKIYDFTLSDVARLTKRQQTENRIKSIERSIQDTKKDTVESMRKEKETATELKNRLIDPSDDRFAADRIVRPKSLDPGMLALDSSTIQWSIKDALVDCNVDGDYDKVTIGAGTITYHNWETKDRYNIAKERATLEGYHPERTWTVEATEFNLLSPDAHWMYAKLNLASGSSSCVILMNTEHIEGKHEIEDNYLYLKLGDITSSASPRFASMIWGNVRYATIQHVHELIEENNEATAQPTGEIIYLHGNDSDITDYRQALTDLPDDVEGTATAVADSLDGEVLIDEFATDPGKPGVTIIPAGVWIFESWCKVDALAGINTLKIIAFKRDGLDAETELFNVSAQIIAAEVELLKIVSEQPDIIIDATDRLVFKYYFSTTSATERTATLYFEGAENYSRIRTAIEQAGGGAGTPGEPGEDGVDAYVYVAYASSNAGTGFSLTPTDLLKYRAEIHSTTALTPVEADFSGATWVKYLGDDGAPGAPGADGDDASPVVQKTGTLVVANWVADGSLFKYVLSHASITATSSVEVIPAKESYDVLVEAEPMSETESAAGSVSIWMKAVPSADVPVTINITEVI